MIVNRKYCKLLGCSNVHPFDDCLLSKTSICPFRIKLKILIKLITFEQDNDIFIMW